MTKLTTQEYHFHIAQAQQIRKRIIMLKGVLADRKSKGQSPQSCRYLTRTIGEAIIDHHKRLIAAKLVRGAYYYTAT